MRSIGWSEGWNRGLPVIAWCVLPQSVTPQPAARSFRRRARGLGVGGAEARALCGIGVSPFCLNYVGAACAFITPFLYERAPLGSARTAPSAVCYRPTDVSCPPAVDYRPGVAECAVVQCFLLFRGGLGKGGYDGDDDDADVTERCLFATLYCRGRKETAAQDLRMLRAPDTPVDQILDAVDSQDSESEETLQGSVLQELCKPSARRPLIAGVGLAVVQQLSGINAVMFYCGKILGSVFDKATADTAAVGIQVLQLVMTGVTIPLMDRAGRRPLLFTAGVGMVVCSGALGLYYHLAGSSSALPDFFAALMLYGYVFAFAIGLGSIPWMIIGEIFPPEVKGVCGSITTAVNWCVYMCACMCVCVCINMLLF